MVRDTSKNILRMPEVEVKTGYKRPTIYRFIKEGLFPKQVPLGLRAVGWVESEIDDWVQSKIDAREAA